MEMDPCLFESCSYLKGRAQHMSNWLGAKGSNSSVLSSFFSCCQGLACPNGLCYMPTAKQRLTVLLQTSAKGLGNYLSGQTATTGAICFLTYLGNLLRRKYKAPWLLPEMTSGLLSSCRGSSLIKLDEGQRLFLRSFLLRSSVEC